MNIRAHTDGACLSNPGPGGWAYVIDRGPYASGAEPRTTNQRMEITAAWRAVEATESPLEVVSDSTYVVNCFRQEWWRGWLERGWKNSRNQPVANRDLWEPFVELVLARGDVTFSWVKGHSGDRLNDAADVLAVAAARTQSGVTGARFTEEVLAGLDSDPAAAVGRGPSGRGYGVVVAGHRPPELGGYDANPTADAVRRQLVEILDAKRRLHPDVYVLTGLGLGAEQLGAEAAAELGVPYVAVLPYPDADSRWPRASRRRFADLRAGAREVVVVSDDAPATRTEAGKALGRRDEWLARHGDEAVMVWDRAEDSLARLFKVFERAFGDDVWILEP